VLSKREFHIRFAADPPIPRGFLVTGRVQTPGFSREQRWLLTDEEEWVHLAEIE
jgi:hypothetical protein